MNAELIALAERRGELKARIAQQRDALGQHLWPVTTALGAADRVLEGAHWLKRHPQVVVGGLVAVLVARPKRAWRWATRGFGLWRSARYLRQRIEMAIEMAVQSGRR